MRGAYMMKMVAPEVDAPVARLVDACLEKHPGKRPQDARALIRLFKSLRSGLGISAEGRMALDTILDHAGTAPPASKPRPGPQAARAV